MKKENQFDSQIYIANEISLWHGHNFQQNKLTQFEFSEAKFKEFESRLKFKLLLKYDWFHLKFSLFQDLIAGTQLKLFFFGFFGGFQTVLVSC